MNEKDKQVECGCFVVCGVFEQPYRVFDQRGLLSTFVGLDLAGILPSDVRPSKIVHGCTETCTNTISSLAGV